jgi:hypothetical protein
VSTWDRIQKSPAVRLDVAEHVDDFAYDYAPAVPVPNGRVVWASHVDYATPEPSPEHALEVRLRHFLTNPKHAERFWREWISSRRYEISRLRRQHYMAARDRAFGYHVRSD